jgi:transposase IS116/IS110/IS902 family protein
LQPVATGRKSPRAQKALIKPKPLPSVATSCRDERMVRRGLRFESVRGLCKSPAKLDFLFRIDLHGLQYAARMEPSMELSGSGGLSGALSSGLTIGACRFRRPRALRVVTPRQTARCRSCSPFPASPGCLPTRSPPRSATSPAYPSPLKLPGYTGLCPRVYQSGESDRRAPLAKQGPVRARVRRRGDRPRRIPRALPALPQVALG